MIIIMIIIIAVAMSGGSSLQAMPRRSILHGRRPREQLLRDRRRADGGPEAREAGSVRAGSHRSAVLRASRPALRLRFFAMSSALRSLYLYVSRKATIACLSCFRDASDFCGRGAESRS